MQDTHPGWFIGIFIMGKNGHIQSHQQKFSLDILGPIKVFGSFAPLQ
jgi:hypothetical protein